MSVRKWSGVFIIADDARGARRLDYVWCEYVSRHVHMVVMTIFNIPFSFNVLDWIHNGSSTVCIIVYDLALLVSYKQVQL